MEHLVSSRAASRVVRGHAPVPGPAFLVLAAAADGAVPRDAVAGSVRERGQDDLLESDHAGLGARVAGGLRLVGRRVVQRCRADGWQHGRRRDGRVWSTRAAGRRLVGGLVQRRHGNDLPASGRPSSLEAHVGVGRAAADDHAVHARGGRAGARPERWDVGAEAERSGRCGPGGGQPVTGTVTSRISEVAVADGHRSQPDGKVEGGPLEPPRRPVEVPGAAAAGKATRTEATASRMAMSSRTGFRLKLQVTAHPRQSRWSARRASPATTSPPRHKGPP
jgi:hypothetical protein